jgi:hypothetical protein
MQKGSAPIQLHVEMHKEQSYEDNVEESAPGAHTMHEPSPVLKLKLEMEKISPLSDKVTEVDSYLIKQRYTYS